MLERLGISENAAHLRGHRRSRAALFVQVRPAVAEKRRPHPPICKHPNCAHVSDPLSEQGNCRDCDRREQRDQENRRRDHEQRCRRSRVAYTSDKTDREMLKALNEAIWALFKGGKLQSALSVYKNKSMWVMSKLEPALMKRTRLGSIEKQLNDIALELGTRDLNAAAAWLDEISLWHANEVEKEENRFVVDAAFSLLSPAGVVTSVIGANPGRLSAAAASAVKSSANVGAASAANLPLGEVMKDFRIEKQAVMKGSGKIAACVNWAGNKWNELRDGVAPPDFLRALMDYLLDADDSVDDQRAMVVEAFGGVAVIRRISQALEGAY